MPQIWSSRDFKPVKTLAGHEAKVTSLDVVGGESLLASEMQYFSLNFLAIVGYIGMAKLQGEGMGAATLM